MQLVKAILAALGWSLKKQPPLADRIIAHRIYNANFRRRRIR